MIGSHNGVMRAPRRSFRHRLLLGTIGGCLAVGAAPALAQSARPAGSEDTSLPGEIVVTATRSSEKLSKVAASVTAISADEIGAGGITDIASLASSVPNLSVGDQFGVNRAFIRGIGLTSIDLGADGAVAFLQDSAILARPAAQLSGFYDVERVEVLRGPQGTLYGRGATAGAINIITKRPTDEWGGYLNLTYGNYDAFMIESAISGPIVEDRLLVRVSGKYDRRDGYGRNVFTGEDVDNRDAFAVRGSVLFRASENLEILVSAEHFEENDNNYAFHYFGATVAPENQLGALLGGESIITFSERNNIRLNLRNIYSDQEAINRRNGTSVTATISWDKDALNIKSITSYHDFYRFNRDDLDASNVWMFGQNNYTEKSETISQEFVGTYKSDRWDLLFGAMYFNEKLFGEVRVPLVNLGILFGLPPSTFDDQNYLQFGTVDINAYGVYLQGTYSFTDKLKLTLGGRYSYENRDGKGSFQFLGSVNTDKSEGWGAFTPTIIVNYQATNDTLFYGSVTRGFKSGVINVGSQNDVINPEFAWGYELGVKSRTADGRISGSLAVFYIDYSDLQVGFVGSDSVVTTVNAASARNYGVELEVRARPTEALELEFFGTYLNAKYTEFTSGDYRQGFAQVDLSGNRLSNAPEWSFRAGANYEFDLGDRGDLNLRADINWQDRVYFTEFNNADATQGAYALLNAGLRYTVPSERWSIDLWGRNLTDEFVITNNIITAPLFNSVRVGSVAPPRTYGVTVGVKF